MYAITPRHHRVWRRHLPQPPGGPRAAYFDRQGIAREYEPARLDGWSPDFRPVLDDGEACAEVKPVSKFPMDVAQRILNAGWKSEVVILGLGPRHAWRHQGDSGRNLVDLTA